MMKRLALGLALLSLPVALVARSGQASGAAAQTPAPDKALAPLQGTWVVNSINGQEPPPMQLVFKGDKYEQVVQDTVDEKGSIKFDATKKPNTLDLAIAEGDDAGKSQLGIVEITGDSMKLKLAIPSAPTRPKDFSQEDGFLLVLLTKQK